jgi:hypothetical protein
MAAMKIEPGNDAVLSACLEELGIAHAQLDSWAVGVDVPGSSVVGWIALAQHMHA